MRASRVAFAVAMLLALAGCGGGGGTGGQGAGTATSSPAPSAPKAGVMTRTAPSAEPASAVTVATSSTSLGTVLVDGKGMTLYMFDPDKQGESTCYQQCAQAWPPLTVKGQAKAGSGVEQSLLGTVSRADGTEQVTYNKWPLYYWASDKAPGDVTGQGVQNVWWVLNPAGDPIRH